MRQGAPSKVLAHDFDVYVPSSGTYMGSLRMMITNTGSLVDQNELENNLNNPSYGQQNNGNHF
jgi:hypothetical protein